MPDCSACHAPVGEADTRCPRCGAPLPPRGPGAVQRDAVWADGAWSRLKRVCGWCGLPSRDARLAACPSCGGPMPPLPARVLAELALATPPSVHPPAAPRVLPEGYAFRIRYTGNTLVMIGIIFTIPLCWSVVFPMIGAVIWYVGARKATRWLRALEGGVAVEGTITRVAKDLQQSINNEHPWQIDFRYETPSGTRDGHVTSWDEMTGLREAGERVWVVYDPVDAEVNAIWPPVW